MSEIYKVSRRVQFHETDLMGIVHHANYLKFFEDARVDWMVNSSLARIHYPRTDLSMAVLETQVKHLSACRFLDEIDVFLQVRLQGLKIEFQYAIYDRPQDQKAARKIAVGRTLHVMVDREMKPKKLARDFIAEMEKWTWTETWL